MRRSRADILALKHDSRILGHCNNPALPFCPVCGCGISSCSVLKYWLGNEKQEVLGCWNVRKFYWHALERGYLMQGWGREALAALARFIKLPECHFKKHIYIFHIWYTHTKFNLSEHTLGLEGDERPRSHQLHWRTGALQGGTTEFYSESWGFIYAVWEMS